MNKIEKAVSNSLRAFEESVGNALRSEITPNLRVTFDTKTLTIEIWDNKVGIRFKVSNWDFTVEEAFIHVFEPGGSGDPCGMFDNQTIPCRKVSYPALERVIKADLEKYGLTNAGFKEIFETAKLEVIEEVTDHRFLEYHNTLYEICDKEHAACNTRCPVYALQDPSERTADTCPHHKNGSSMAQFIAETYS